MSIDYTAVLGYGIEITDEDTDGELVDLFERAPPQDIDLKARLIQMGNCFSGEIYYFLCINESIKFSNFNSVRPKFLPEMRDQENYNHLVWDDILEKFAQEFKIENSKIGWWFGICIS